MSLLNLKQTSSDLGRCLLSSCPHCQEHGVFILRKATASLHFMFLNFGECGTVYQLVCDSCGFTKDISPHELTSAQAAQKLLEQYESGILTTDAYNASIQTIDFPTLNALQLDAHVWSCSNCREKIPMTMFSCWNCGQEITDLRELEIAESSDLPALPEDITRSSNPWEN